MGKLSPHSWMFLALLLLTGVVGSSTALTTSAEAPTANMHISTLLGWGYKPSIPARTHRLLDMANASALGEQGSNDDTDKEDGGGDTTAGRAIVVGVTAVQMAGLFYAFQNGMTGWEPLWVHGIELANYFFSLIAEEGTGGLELDNGVIIPWRMYCGWLITCPVLLMFLTAMTTYGGRAASVRLVPLLIADQVMILAGATAAAYTGVAKWVFYFVACTCGGIVFTLSAMCLYALHRQMGYDRSYRWGRLHKELRSADAKDTMGDGAAAAHSCGARHEAAKKLVSNHAAVLKDLTRSDGPPKSQPKMSRLPGQENDVEDALEQIARRLIGRYRGQAPRGSRPATAEAAGVWAASCNFLAARLQSSTEEVARVPGHTERKPDMGPEAAAAFRAVLAEVGGEQGGGSWLRRARYWLGGDAFEARALTAGMAIFFMVGWMIFPVAWTLGPFGLGLVSKVPEGRMYIAGDLLAKNAFSALAVVLKHKYLQHLNTNPPPAATTTTKDTGGGNGSKAAPTPRPCMNRRPSQIMLAESRGPAHGWGASSRASPINSPVNSETPTPSNTPLFMRKGGAKAEGVAPSEAVTSLLLHKVVLAAEAVSERLRAPTASEEAFFTDTMEELHEARDTLAELLRLIDTTVAAAGDSENDPSDASGDGPHSSHPHPKSTSRQAKANEVADVELGKKLLDQAMAKARSEFAQKLSAHGIDAKSLSPGAVQLTSGSATPLQFYSSGSSCANTPDGLRRGQDTVNTPTVLRRGANGAPGS